MMITPHRGSYINVTIMKIYVKINLNGTLKMALSSRLLVRMNVTIGMMIFLFLDSIHAKKLPCCGYQIKKE